MKKYYIKELKIEIEAIDDKEFEQKKEKLLTRNMHYNTGGHKSIKKSPIIKDL